MGNALQGIPSVISDERPRVWRYSHSAGPIRSRFLLNLRDQQKITGTKCPTCGKVYVPARSTCLKCFEDMSDWVEVSHEGTLKTFTIVHEPLPSLKSEIPFILGIIQLDGADTGIVHRLGDVDSEELRIGMRVKAVFEGEVKGDIRDIKFFRPADSA